MKEITPEDLDGLAPAGDQVGQPHFRVLVADGDEADRRFIIWQLGKAWPCERDMMVECAADGAEALEKIRGHRYALVVLDWNLSHLDGALVLRGMREEGVRIPVVVVSDQRREAVARDLETMAAAFVRRGTMNPYSFGSAIAASIQMQEDRCPVRPDLETMPA